MADAICTSIPSLFGDPPETVLSFTLPIACALVRAEAKAARSKKAAKKYRRIRREVRELLRTEPDRLAARPVLANTIPFDPEAWHTALRPGAGHDLMEVP